VANIVRAKRLGWDEGPTGNVTRIDILDPYDYADDDLEGEHVERHVANDRVGPYVLHLVGGQVADPHTIVVIRPDEGAQTA
jgi:hypothetical protein